MRYTSTGWPVVLVALVVMKYQAVWITINFKCAYTINYGKPSTLGLWLPESTDTSGETTIPIHQGTCVPGY